MVNLERRWSVHLEQTDPRIAIKHGRGGRRHVLVDHTGQRRHRVGGHGQWSRDVFRMTAERSTETRLTDAQLPLFTTK